LLNEAARRLLLRPPRTRPPTACGSVVDGPIESEIEVYSPQLYRGSASFNHPVFDRICAKKIAVYSDSHMKCIPVALALAFLACSSSEEAIQPNVAGDVGDDTPVVALPDDPSLPIMPAPSDTMRTTGDVNLRDKPSLDGAVLRVIPTGTVVTLLDKVPQNNFYNVEALGVRGWMSGKYLEANTPAPMPMPGDLSGAPSPDNAIARAKPAMGFSYYWAGGAWLAEGPTAATKGSCSGNCPTCNHSGKYGADCSGLVAKAWQYGAKDLATNSHPYGTIHFVTPKAGFWIAANRGAMQKADALVHNEAGSGHIVLYERGDGWGAPVVYECKGCAYGCVYNARNFGSTYKAIRRAGF
jgi:hypothetical protein